MSEMTVSVPLLEEVAAELLKKGALSRDLTSAELSEVMKSVVSGLVEGQSGVVAAITNMAVHIGKSRGEVDASVQVSKPIKASIGLNVALGNQEGSNTRLALLGLEVKEQAGGMAKLALKAVNLKGRASSILQDPNAGLYGAFQKELTKRGVALIGMQLQFTPKNTLSVGLQGRPAPVPSR